mmetsp:Transcript_122608/g.306216  ORF Transcript_122608/g.306216 Transcript_122608/m.306216 type:complete len:174 (+) Transcript_122608:1914-2435(+)
MVLGVELITQRMCTALSLHSEAFRAPCQLLALVSSLVDYLEQAWALRPRATTILQILLAVGSKSITITITIITIISPTITIIISTPLQGLEVADGEVLRLLVNGTGVPQWVKAQATQTSVLQGIRGIQIAGELSAVMLHGDPTHQASIIDSGPDDDADADGDYGAMLGAPCPR